MLPFFPLLMNPQFSAHLYLDPGSGSFVLQLALASLFGGLFAIKALRKKIVSFFLHLIKKDECQTNLSVGGGDSPDNPVQ